MSPYVYCRITVKKTINFNGAWDTDMWHRLLTWVNYDTELWHRIMTPNYDTELWYRHVSCNRESSASWSLKFVIRALWLCVWQTSTQRTVSVTSLPMPIIANVLNNSETFVEACQMSLKKLENKNSQNRKRTPEKWEKIWRLQQGRTREFSHGRT